MLTDEQIEELWYKNPYSIPFARAIEAGTEKYWRARKGWWEDKAAELKRKNLELSAALYAITSRQGPL